jgi:hypothetical protein
MNMVAKYPPLNVQRSFQGCQQIPSQFDTSSCSIETAIFVESATPRGPHRLASLSASPTMRELPFIAKVPHAQPNRWEHAHQSSNSHRCDNDTSIAPRVPPASPKSTLRQHQLFEVLAPVSRSCDSVSIDGSRGGSSVTYDLSDTDAVVPPLETTDHRKGSLPSPERAATVILHAGGKELYMEKMRELFSSVGTCKCGSTLPVDMM